MSKNNNGKHKLMSVLCVVLALILALMVAGTIYVESVFSRMGDLDTETLSSSEAEALLNQTEETLDLLTPTEPEPELRETVESKSWIGLVLIAGVLTFLLIGALIFRGMSRRNRY